MLNFLKSEAASTTVEYAIIAPTLALALIFTVQEIGPRVSAFLGALESGFGAR